MTTKKTRSVRTIILPAVSRRDLCYASENEGFRFYQIPPSPSTFAVDSHEHGFDKPPLASYPKWFHLGSEGALFLWLVPEGGDLTVYLCARISPPTHALDPCGGHLSWIFIELPACPPPVACPHTLEAYMLNLGTQV